MGGPKRFVKKIPPSGAAPSFKLTLPHQVIHQYLLHLVDNDLELAGSHDAEQTWHASIAPRRNKERSEFTLQGWRLFAEAHKVQAGDQVAFELVNENRLVAQVIKHADGAQAPRAAAKPSGIKRKAPAGAPAPRSVSQRSAVEFVKAMDDVPLPTEEQWNSLPECLSSAAGSSFSQKESFSHADAKAPQPPSYKAEPQVVPEWNGEDSQGANNMRMELGYHDSRNSLDSTTGTFQRPRQATPPMLVPELSLSSAMGANDTPPSPMAYTPFSDLLNDPIHDFIMGDEPILHDGLFRGETPTASQGRQTPTRHVFASTIPPSGEDVVKDQLEDLSSLVQSLQRQARAAQAEADAAQQRCATLRSSLEGLQSSLRSHSRRALKAAMGLENCSASLSYTHSVPPQMTASLGQLKDSLSQLLIMAIDDDHLAPNPSHSSHSQGTFDQFAMPM